MIVKKPKYLSLKIKMVFIRCRVKLRDFNLTVHIMGGMWYNSTYAMDMVLLLLKSNYKNLMLRSPINMTLL